MQLEPTRRASSIRARLGAAACVLLASRGAMPARADSAPGVPSTQFDATGLAYGEQGRAKVVEPTARITRIFANGQSLSAQLGLDVISGASPSGALPSGRDEPVQTTTTPSGNTTSETPDPGQLPVAMFRDVRGALDTDWSVPFGPFTSTLGGHYSREKDYQSLGGSAQLSVDMMHKLTTLTVGGGINQDQVFPVGGLRVGLSDGRIEPGSGRADKRVRSGMVGLSRILTRRWMLGASGSWTRERGYLTDPYKIVSLVQPVVGVTTGFVTERRPGTRDRTDLLGTSVYHFERDVLYLSYRYYWDDWKVRSHTVDAKVRHELGDERYVEPHLRYYAQTSASFYRDGLVDGEVLPDLVSSDYRLGPLHSVTVGGTFGFRVPGSPGEWTVRAEYIAQFGNGQPRDAVGVQRQFDLFPTVSIGSLVVGYSVAF